MRANDSKSYLPYLNKIVDQYSNTYHHSVIKKLINADNVNTNVPTFKVNDRVRTTKYKNISKCYTEN